MVRKLDHDVRSLRAEDAHGNRRLFLDDALGVLKKVIAVDGTYLSAVADVRLLTNLLDLEAEIIGLLYRQRWQIELFFIALRERKAAP